MADKEKTASTTETPNYSGKWKACESNYNLARHMIPFLQDVPFYAEISRHVQKRLSRDLPTMAVTFDPRADELVMYVNPDFMEKQTNWQTRGGITHEYDHLIFGHLNARRRDPASEWNIGTDLAINSLIVRNAGKPRDAEEIEGNSPLPKGALIPGQRPWCDPDKMKELSAEQQKATKHLCDLIEKLEPHKSSEFYFNKVMQDAQKNGYGAQDVEYVIGSMDDHSGWDESSEEMKEYVEGKIKAIVEKAVRHADSMTDGWGNIPAEIREDIRRSVSNIVNWRQVLRQFVGQLVRGARTTSIKRINRRYPYIHPGIKRGYTAKLLIAIDQSGSVGDEMLEMFFSELASLTRKVDVSILPFDCDCDVKEIIEWKKGTRPDLKRTRMGGTNFDAPTKLVNDPRNRGRWDGMLIMTDGCAPQPMGSRVKRGWILGQGCKLEWGDSNEIVISLSKDRPMAGAWRLRTVTDK